MSAYAQQNPAATAYEAEYQAGCRKSEQRDQLEDRYRRDMRVDMILCRFLNEYTDYEEWEEPLSRILSASYGNADHLACLVVGIREQLIQHHAERKARVDSED